MRARLELVEAEAQASFYESAGLPVLRVGGASCTANPHVPDDVMLNRVNALGVAAPAGEDELDEIDQFFRAQRTRYAVAVSPVAESHLAHRLRERGFDHGYAWMKFHRGLEEQAAVTTSLRVEDVEGGDDVFGGVLAEAFALPQVRRLFRHLPERDGWYCFVAYDGDEPVGAAGLFAHGGVGWLGIAGTRPEHRGKGAQAALIAARIERARALGLDGLTTETGERLEGRPSASYRNILRAGFTESYLRPNLLSPG